MDLALSRARSEQAPKKSTNTADLRTPIETILPGDGLLHVQLQGSRSQVVRMNSRAPLKLFVPPRQHITPHVYMSSYGGGMLAGDGIQLKVVMEEGSRCLISTQASTKIYRNPQGLPCGQTVDSHIEEGALLVMAPESICPYAESQYDQHQKFHVAEGGNLVLIDWFSSGRYEQGERFQFRHYGSRQSIFYGDRHVFEDAIWIEPSQLNVHSKFSVGHYNCIGLMVLVGDKLQPMIEKILSEEKQRTLLSGRETFVIALPIPNGLVMRILSLETQPVRQVFEKWLQDIDPLLETKSWRGKY